MVTYIFAIPDKAWSYLEAGSLYQQPESFTPDDVKQKAIETAQALYNARTVKRGKGHSNIVQLDRWGLMEVYRYMIDGGDPLGRDTDPDARSEQAACRHTAKRIEELLAVK